MHVFTSNKEVECMCISRGIDLGVNSGRSWLDQLVIRLHEGASEKTVDSDHKTFEMLE